MLWEVGSGKWEGGDEGGGETDAEAEREGGGEERFVGKGEQ